MQSKRSCIFCGSAASLTGEHIWSDWLSQQLGKRKVRYNWTEADGNVREYRLVGLNAKVNIVCDTCNSTWMSDLENAVKPIVQPMILTLDPVTLSPDQLAIIAQWGFKAAILADQMRMNKVPFFYTCAQRRAFMQKGKIPQGVQMWLAAVDQPFGLLKGGDTVTDRSEPNGFRLNSCTYVIGYLVIQITCSRWTSGKNRRNHAPATITQDPASDDFAIPFWPLPSSPITWPPPKLIAKDSIDVFANRFNSMIRSQ